jgi:hypothetical protein
MVLHPKSKIVALRALLAVTWGQKSADFLQSLILSRPLLRKFRTRSRTSTSFRAQIVLQLADIEDATVTSAQIALHPVDRRVGNARDDEPTLCAPWECPPNSA